MNAPVTMEETKSAEIQSVLRKLAVVWTDFETRIEATPLLRRLGRGQLTVEHYRSFLINLRQQVVDGACWISRAASNLSETHFELRSTLMRHAQTEHRDYRLLEEDFVSAGGRLEEIRSAQKNIGSEALSAWMFHMASQTDPLDLIGAMFIIEGLGAIKASEWGKAVIAQTGLPGEAARFLSYHGENDADHMEEFADMLALLPLDAELEARIVKCAEVTGRLYALQIEEIG